VEGNLATVDPQVYEENTAFETPAPYTAKEDIYNDEKLPLRGSNAQYPHIFVNSDFGESQ